jgi:hypothetical protein
MMTKTKCILALLLGLTASCAAGRGGVGSTHLIVCGREEVTVMRQNGDPVWIWRATEHLEIPEELRKKFESTDDCKPVDGGRKILITSSGGAVALVERPSGKVLFYAGVPNAHSAELLPASRVVVASSTHENGNRLILFDLAVSDKPLASDELKGAHGVVWDAERGLLWALGTDELRAYEVSGDRATGSLLLARRGSYTPPNAGGHDLRPVPGTPYLNLTTYNHVWQFDRDLLSFRTHPEFGERAGVKCIDIDPATGQVVLIQSETDWWSEHLLFPVTGLTLEFKGKKLYKARWTPPLE